MLPRDKTNITDSKHRLVRLLRLPLKAWLSITAVAMLFAAAMLYVAIGNVRYELSTAQTKLLGAPSIAASDLQETPDSYMYNMAEDQKDESEKQVVAAATESDSTSKVPYTAELSKDSSKGITFGDADGNLSFTMVPNQDTMNGRTQEGRVIYPTAGGQKSVYTFKRNGIKADILLNRAPTKTMEYSWTLDLSGALEARMLPDGGVGIYSANPYLFGNLQVSDEKSQKLVDNAKKNGEKTQLAFVLPAPFIVDAKGQKNTEDVSYKLEGNILTLEARNMLNKQYPLTIDPTVVVTTTAEFLTGLDDGMIDYTTTSNQVGRSAVSIGTAGTWTLNSNYFSIPRQDHASVAYNGYLYVIGGNQGLSNSNCKDSGSSPVCNDVQYAAINSNGSIGTWTTNSTYFSIPRDGHTAVAYNGYLYVMGGTLAVPGTDCKNSGSHSYCNDVQYAPINSDGSIGTWATSSNYFSFPRTSHTSVAYNGYLYVTGGYHSASDTDCKNSGSSAVCNDTQYASINNDGSIGTWATNSNYFSIPRYGHTSVAYNGYLYVVGGALSSASTNCKLSGSSFYCNDTQYASINNDGSIGSWTISSNYFSFPRTGHTSVAYNGYLYVIGGLKSGSDTDCKDSGSSGICNDTQYAPINSDGSVGTWATNSNYFAFPRTLHKSVAYNGYLYVIGGFQQASDTNCKNSGSSDRCTDIQYTAIDTGTPTFGEVSTFTTDDSYFVTPRASLTSVAYNGYLYVIGGSHSLPNDTVCRDSGSEVVCNDVQYAAINSNGSIGTWTTNSTYFSIPRQSHTSVAYNGYLYVIGGSQENSDTDCKEVGESASFYCNDVQYAPINSNGSIGTWTTNSNYFDFPRGGHTSVAYSGYLYVIGGSKGSASNGCTFSGGSTTFCSDTQYAPINSDGSIGTWTTDGSYFSTPRLGHGSVAYNGYLYVVGGRQEAVNTACKDDFPDLARCNDVQYAAIAGDGSIGTWTTNSAYFWYARSGLFVTAYNGHLYLGGGFEDSNDTSCKDSGTSRYCNDIQSGPILSDGSVSFFSTSANYFAFYRQNLASATYNGRLYITGGFKPGSDTDCKDAGSVNQCNDTQYTSTLSPAQQGVYERIFDTGTTPATNLRMNSLLINGQTVCGAHLSYRTAGSDYIFGATTTVPFVLAGTATTLSSVTNKRYILVRYTLDDQSCGTQSYITDITLTWSYDPPDAPTLNSPANAAISVSTLPSFQMRSPQTNNSYLRYKIEVCSTSNCSSIVRTIDQTSSQTGWTGQDTQTSTAYVGNSSISSSTMANHDYQTSALSYGTQYWWRAYAIDPAYSNTFSAASSIYTFSTNYPPTVPTLISPANTASNVSVMPDFRLSSTDQDSDYIRYKIEVCSTSNCSVIVRTIDQTSSQTGWQGQSQQSGTAYSTGQEASHVYQPTELGISTQYWWRAYAIDPGGTNTFTSASTIGTFTTGTSPGIQVKLRGGTNIKGGTSF